MAKKDFTQAGLSAAEAFISTPEETIRPERKATAKKATTGKAQAPKEVKLPVGFVLQREAKSKHLQLLVRPFLLQALKDTASKKGVSVNEYCNQVLEKAVKGE
jgi:predicted DNA binding CopG/RHH family protein